MWIPYSKLNVIEKIGEGAFATVYVAVWMKLFSENTQALPVALKVFNRSENGREELSKELNVNILIFLHLNTYYNIGNKTPTFLQCYGISRNKSTNQHILVLQYARLGSLRKNLSTIAGMSWEKKLGLLGYIASELQLIHSHNIIHCDLHSGNIFQNDLYNACIGDLGLSRLANDDLKSRAYGNLPYMAPELLSGGSYTRASDVYSFGIIMWEITSGRIVSSEYERYKYNESRLALGIWNGLRPKVIKGIPLCYQNLLERCWNSDPLKRPSAIEIYETINSWKNDVNVLSEFLKSDNAIEIKDYISNNNIDNSEIYCSKFTDYIDEQLTTDKQQSNECIISDSIEQLFIDKQQNNEHTNSDNFFIINEHSITDRRNLIFINFLKKIF
ncbi:kinase-like domain-containing protein [Gigaspora rosea]|uniref:Kinase-like domain-containing protein n=1 Tax=Gigaspora rosea TaxID=44941 RepID=A0A397VJ52_9GLOM|nr:kinase-like domain-containing protein [Gigaspora rosea]